MPVRPWYKRKRNLILLAIVVILTTAIAAPLAIFKPWEGSSQSNLLPRDAMITPSSDNSAQVNQYTPPLDQPFDYQKGDVKIRGVSLGGWLVLEPFITPSLFNPYVPNGVVDEWTLCAHLGPDAATNLVEEHYATWVTEDTFVQIKDLGLNHVRIPIGYWAMGNLTTDEPFIPDLSWKYLLRGIEWARKYGIRVMVELHAAPGSQNGWNQSGKMGQITWINGTTGWTNAQRTLSYLQNMAAFFASPDYMHVNTLMGLLNEPAARAIGADNVMAWYRLALETVRNATGNGKGPWAIIHDGFLGLQAWSDFMRGSDRLMIGMEHQSSRSLSAMIFNQEHRKTKPQLLLT
jgi:glucan 1,3-beta-glucosidase